MFFEPNAGVFEGGMAARIRVSFVLMQLIDQVLVCLFLVLFIRPLQMLGYSIAKSVIL